MTAEVVALLDSAETIITLREMLREAQLTLEFVLDEAEDHSDIEDGDNGPRPNVWMDVADAVRRTLEKMK